MSAAHTPGPWTWEEYFNGLYGSGQDNAVLEYSPYENMWLSHNKNRETNARLIAAAPELLALVIRYRNETPLGNQPHMIAHEVDVLIEKIAGAKP